MARGIIVRNLDVTLMSELATRAFGNTSICNNGWRCNAADNRFGNEPREPCIHPSPRRTPLLQTIVLSSYNQSNNILIVTRIRSFVIDIAKSCRDENLSTLLFVVGHRYKSLIIVGDYPFFFFFLMQED